MEQGRTWNKKTTVGIAVAAVFVSMLTAFFVYSAGTSSTLSAQAQQDVARFTGNPNAPEEVASPLPYQKVKVYIFPRDIDKFQDAGELMADIKLAAGIKLAMEAGRDTGASIEGIYDRNGDLAVPDGTEVYISPDFKRPDGSAITVADLAPDMKFGNGLVVGDLLVRVGDAPIDVNEKWALVPAIWLVVGGEEISKADSQVEVMDLVAKTHVSSLAKYKEVINDD